jgi:hypothetical protein
MLSYQDSLECGNQRKNTENMLNVKEIPCNNQITRLLDCVEPEEFDENFKDCIRLADKYRVLDQYKVLDGGVLIALDGLWFHSSEKVHCEHCLHITKAGKTTYYHRMAAAVLVRPGGEVVLPLIPEMIRDEDKPAEAENDAAKTAKESYEKQKQDCERNAAKRMLEKYGEYYKELKATLLGDDLYSNHNTCKAVLDSGLSFLFTCKDDSHPWIAEQFKYSYPETLNTPGWTGRYHLEHRYKWVNGIENRADGEKLLVNYIYFEIYNREKDKIVYKNSWNHQPRREAPKVPLLITNKSVTKESVGLLVDCARAR